MRRANPTTIGTVPLNLPNPRHAPRVPPHIAKEQLARIRQAAYVLPQVVKPADYITERSAGFEEHLDKLGLVLLQKPVAGARPSRWIAPALMDSALAHLDALGTGPSVRPLTLERTAALEGLGVSRHAGAWTRLISHTLELSEPGWRVPVLLRAPVDDAAVWAFYRNGDKDALLQALGTPPPYPHAGEMLQHLEALVARSHSHKPHHLASLLPRLQSECATPQPLADLKTAWTQAIVGVPANEVIIICSAYAVPALENLLGLCGERCEVLVFERKQHVELLPQPLPISELQLGDAVVAFSRRDVLMLRDRIATAGHPVSVIYGALPPEVRRREAERFAQGESHILVATDAIGMGLNLPIRRILFSTMTKFDGVGDRSLNESEVHQIAGRAGRFGIHEEGFVGVLKEAEPTAQRTLKELLAKTPRAPQDFHAPVAPSPWHVDTIASRLHLSQLREVLGVFVEQLKLDNAHFAVAELEQMLELAEALDKSASRLTLRERFIYAQAPVDTRTDSQLQEFLDWSSSHALTGKAGTPWFLDAVDGHSRLERMEQALRACTLWLWLDLRFPGVYGHVEAVIALRGQLNDGIERQLKGKRPLAQMRQRRAQR